MDTLGTDARRQPSDIFRYGEQFFMYTGIGQTTPKKKWKKGQMIQKLI